MTILLDIGQAIVSRIGLSETLVVMVLGAIWTVYMIWNRWAPPPRGIWRLGKWFPLLFCLHGVRGGISEAWQLYDFMIQADAFNEAQKEMFIRLTALGTLRLLSVGVVGTLFLFLTTRPPARAIDAKTNTGLNSVDENSSIDDRTKASA